jgi:hypothetical protein
MRNIDSSFYKKLEELHGKKFDWGTNNCGFFVGYMLQFMHGKDFLREFVDKCTDKETSFNLIKQKGGWHKVLSDAGLVKRQDDAMHVGDVVICENAIGIFDGYKGLFAGGVFRSREKITDVYYYLEN